MSLDLETAKACARERIRENWDAQGLPDVLAIRTRLGLSQRALADIIGVTTDAVRFWEYRRRRPSGAAAKALRALGVTGSQLAENKE